MNKQYDEAILKKLQNTELQMLKDIIAVCEKHNIGYSVAYGTLIGTVRHKGFIPWDDDMDLIMFRDDYDKFCSIFQDTLSDKYKLMSPINDKNYCGNVIKVMKKGTRFINKHNNKLKCEMGIFIDIFVYDKVSGNIKQYEKQKRKSRMLAMLLFLSGASNPEIPINGIVGKCAKIICFVMHYLLKLIPDVSVKLFNRYNKICMLANDEDTDVYTVYQAVNADERIINRKNFEPYKKLPFEDIEVNVPREYDKFLTKVYGNYMELPPLEERVNHAADLLDFGEDN